MPRSIITSFGLAALMIALPPPLRAQEKVPPGTSVRTLNGARVYFPATLATGESCVKSRIGTVRSRTVFEAIPEYREIRRRDLDPNSAEYLLYMKKASDRFKEAVSRTVSRGGYDLIAEKGAITCTGAAPPDITEEVIRNL